jgi:hypothetical protein
MTYRIPDHIVWQDVPGELALFDARDQTYSALNGSAAAIWREVARGVDQDTIVRTLAAQYDLPDHAIAADVTAFLTDAVGRGLLVAGAA